MICYYFLEIFSFFEISIEFDPILFYNFFRKIVNKTFNKIDYFVIGNVCPLETLHIRFLGALQFDPT